MRPLISAVSQIHRCLEAVRWEGSGCLQGNNMTFYGWLKRQKHRRDLVGYLALDYCEPPVCCPRDPEQIDEIFLHLEWVHGGRNCRVGSSGLSGVARVSGSVARPGQSTRQS
jgi:hypothetical protein